MQLLRQPDAEPYEIVRLPENSLRHLTPSLSFVCVLTKILCVKYAVTPLNGNAGYRSPATGLQPAASAAGRQPSAILIFVVILCVPLFTKTKVRISHVL